jgi:acid phosphatase type 7
MVHSLQALGMFLQPSASQGVCAREKGKPLVRREGPRKGKEMSVVAGLAKSAASATVLRGTVVGTLAVAILLTVGCGSLGATPKQTAEQASPQRSAKQATQTAGQTGAQQNTAYTIGDPVVVAAGDIADCATKSDEATGHLLARIGGTVLTLGDNAYEDGTAAEFRKCYDPTWGKYKARTKPSPGNHDYTIGETSIGTAKGYFGYFGKAAGDRGKGYYSYNLGRWHLLSLNSNCAEVGHCERSSRQMRWLKANLAANHDKRCTLAYFHHPRFSSGEEHGSTPEVKPLWDALYAADVDVVLSAHEHNYERFAPQDPNGRRNPKRGIREFVVGTGGGEGHYPILEPIANSKVHNDHTYGVLKLTLHPKRYTWLFVPVAGETYADSGSGRCHA